MKKTKMKHLSTHNTKDFFAGMKAGDLFTFNQKYFKFAKVIEMGVRQGVKVGLVADSSRCVIIEDGFGPAIRAAEKHGMPASDIALLLSLPLNLSIREPAEKAAYLVSALLGDGGIGRHFSRNIEFQEYESYYGLPKKEMSALLKKVINGRPALAVANEIMKEATGMKGTAWGNWLRLTIAGLPGLISDFSTDFRGKIRKAWKTELTGRTVTVIETECGGNAQFYLADVPSEYYGSFEGALFAGMFGRHRLAAKLLYEDASK